MADGLTNDGTILLESQNSNYSDTLATGSGTFTNAADGTIQVRGGLGRRLRITDVGQPGQIDVAPDAPASPALDNQGQVRRLLVHDHHRDLRRRRRLDHRPGYLLQLRPLCHRSPATPTTILLEGTATPWTTDNPPNTTLWVQGNGYIEQRQPGRWPPA